MSMVLLYGEFDNQEEFSFVNFRIENS